MRFHALPILTTLLSLTFNPLPTSASLPANITADLGQYLSPGAQIVLPGSSNFPFYDERWSDGGRPIYGPVVVVATEKDVSVSVKYANAHKVPFLATTAGHGTWWGLAAFDGGLVIYMRNLNKLEVLPDGKSAIIGGGIIVDEVIHGLWPYGKQTTTGACNCVSVAGPALGGGHGYFQGQYGNLGDQVISARVVLASGEVVTADETRNADLYWALRGAGHNFGIVTEFRYRIHDIVEPTWAYEFLIFDHSKVEEIYTVSNEMMESQPPQAILWSTWVMNVTIDPVHPIVNYSIFYNGPYDKLREFTQPLHALKPLSSLSGTTPYPELTTLTGQQVGSVLCGYQGSVKEFPFDVVKYDVPGILKWWDIYSAGIKAEPALDKTFCLLEGYSWQAVQAVPAASTAFPHRQQRLLLSPVVTYDFTANTTLDDVATSWGEAMRAAGRGKFKPRSYVNYASGDETLQALYGYEPWRLARLRQLKKKYDPKGQFNFYAGIH
ncbi:hypothetical protein B0T17DRAFT_483777 [Bombardia bombarda]|uniref:FAD-binding PCMH-type domain-containing protein n=1 Tax=Bombardia bombarda TaxID=252184 RepID=A0AA39XQD0_9PEZI|nr:hypothetical protein B0T17DRAFT_483777 [Bombardia bombarda]